VGGTFTTTRSRAVQTQFGMYSADTTPRNDPSVGHGAVGSCQRLSLPSEAVRRIHFDVIARRVNVDREFSLVIGLFSTTTWTIGYTSRLTSLPTRRRFFNGVRRTNFPDGPSDDEPGHQWLGRTYASANHRPGSAYKSNGLEAWIKHYLENYGLGRDDLFIPTAGESNRR